MGRHVNIPIFIPHLGCPNKCVFCNQKIISGVVEFAPDDVDKIIREALTTIEEDAYCEIAFFGGSFTGIDSQLMIELLKTANKYLKQGRIQSIRLSTRPDYISIEILEILKSYGVTVIELGLQSSSDRILQLSSRGHDHVCEEKACKMITDFGFSLVGQMMIGLPGSTLDDEIATAEFICRMGAPYARIYPTVVFSDTELYYMTKSGKYLPLTIEEAVYRSAEVYKIFASNGVKVIRVGLCSSENLLSDSTYFAGPNHPALGELVINKLFYDNIKLALAQLNDYKNSIPTVFVPKGALSKAIGQRGSNKKKLIMEFELSDLLFVENDRLEEFDIRISI